MLAALSPINFQKLAIISRFLSLMILVIEWLRRVAGAQLFHSEQACSVTQSHSYLKVNLPVHGWGTQRPSMKRAERKFILHWRLDSIPCTRHLANTCSYSCRVRARVLVPANKADNSLRHSSDSYTGKSWVHTLLVLPLFHVIKQNFTIPYVFYFC